MARRRQAEQKQFMQALGISPCSDACPRREVAENRGIFCPGISAQIQRTFLPYILRIPALRCFIAWGKYHTCPECCIVPYCARVQVLSIRGKHKFALSTRVNSNMIRHSTITAGTVEYGHESSSMGNRSTKVREQKWRTRDRRGQYGVSNRALVLYAKE